MEHEEIRRKLSAYLDNAVSAEDKSDIKAHLKTCGSCREAIADLELTVGYLKTLPDVEPPPWLTARIMAKVRDIPGPGQTVWRRIFFPLHLKLPLEALAIVFLCITGYYLARTIDMQAPPTEPVPPRQRAAGPSPAHPAASPQISPAPAPRSGATPFKTTAPHPATLPSPSNEQLPITKAPEFEPAPARPAEPAHQPELGPMEEGPNLESEAGPPLDKAEKSALGGTAKKAKRGRINEGAAGTAQTDKGEITLAVDDPGAAVGAIEQAVTALGGRISGHSYSEESHFLIVRISTQRVPALIERFGHIGTVLEKPRVPKGAGGMTDLTIRW